MEIEVGKQIMQRGYVPKGRKTDGADILITEKTLRPEEVMYVDDPDIIKLGSFSMDVRKVKKVEVTFTLGATEIHVEAVDVKSGKRAGTTVDFLS